MPEPEPDPAAETGFDPRTTFSALAQVVYGGATFGDVYQSVCASAAQLLDVVDHASLMVNQNGRFLTGAATDEVARSIDKAERSLLSGPCVDAVLEEAPQVDHDLTRNPSWPTLAAYVVANTPVRSVAGFRLVVDEHKVGALNLFSDTAGAFDDRCLSEAMVLTAFASVALVAVGARQEATSLRDGLSSNREIGKAIGLLMAFHQVTDEEAFELLRKSSQDLNIKLAKVAQKVVENHNQR